MLPPEINTVPEASVMSQEFSDCQEPVALYRAVIQVDKSTHTANDSEAAHPAIV